MKAKVVTSTEGQCDQKVVTRKMGDCRQWLWVMPCKLVRQLGMPCAMLRDDKSVVRRFTDRWLNIGRVRMGKTTLHMSRSPCTCSVTLALSKLSILRIFAIGKVIYTYCHMYLVWWYSGHSQVYTDNLVWCLYCKFDHHGYKLTRNNLREIANPGTV